MIKLALLFSIFVVLSIQSAFASIQTINAIATGVATTTQALARGTDPNAPQPVPVQPLALTPQPVATTAQASNPTQTPQQTEVSASPAPTTPAPSSTQATTPTTTAAASPAGPSTSSAAPATETTAPPPPVNVTANDAGATSSQPPAKGELQTIEGVYAYGSAAQQELKVKIVIAPKSLGQGKTNLADALEGVTAMVCVGQANCQYAFPSKEGYFESVLKLPSSVNAEKPQALVFVVACSSLGCVKSKLNTQVQFGA